MGKELVSNSSFRLKKSKEENIYPNPTNGLMKKTYPNPTNGSPYPLI